MEVVLQWIDEIDDLVFAGFSLWQRLRRLCLAIALTAALGLHALPGLGATLGSVTPLLDIALIAVGVWVLLVMISIRAEDSWRAVADRA